MVGALAVLVLGLGSLTVVHAVSKGTGPLLPNEGTPVGPHARRDRFAPRSG
jgi:hypothetical protein